ncbi:hypothetical protein KKH18_06880 [bacterium]|nr:hypothetical protein [bacterium]
MCNTNIHTITITPDSCAYDKSIRDILHEELAANKIELDIPLVDFCTTAGLRLTRKFEQETARLCAENARLQEELAATWRRASFNRSCAEGGETWTQVAEDNAANLGKEQL